MIRRIELIGGPGCGKTTLALNLTNRFKICGIDVEHVPEIIPKEWALRNIVIRDYDQVYIFAEQLHAQDIILRNDSDSLVISDAPPRICLMYGRFYGAPGIKHLYPLLDEFDEKYPPLTIFIDRPNIPYTQTGRFENEDTANAVHSEFECYLKEHLKEKFFRFQADCDLIFPNILAKLAEDDTLKKWLNRLNH